MSAQPWREQSRQAGTPQILALENYGFTVRRITDYHYRVNEVLDLYPTSRRWHNLRTGKRGGYGHETTIEICRRVLGGR